MQSQAQATLLLCLAAWPAKCLSASVPSCEQGGGPSLEGLLGPSTYWWEPEPLLLSPFFFFCKEHVVY